MLNKTVIWSGVLLLAAILFWPATAAAKPEDGHLVLKKYCFQCHGSEKQESGLRLDTAIGLREGGDSGEPLLVLGKLDQSLIWKRLAIEGDMPPEGKPQPSEAERELVREWIEAGSAYPEIKREEDALQLAAKARDVLMQHCVRCHGEKKIENLDMRDVRTLTSVRKGKKAYVAGGKPDESLVWLKIDSESMPPKGSPRLTEEDKQIVLRWIKAGALPYEIEHVERPWVSEESVHDAIRKHLEKTRPAFRSRQRFFTLHHLHNNRTVSDQTLRTFKAALSKAINSLTWEATIVVPKQIDEAGTVFAIDLRHLGWTNDKQWKVLMAEYPYALKFSETDLQQEANRQVLQSTGETLPFLRVRADWFVSKATRPPLYETLLELPATVAELEKKLEVEAEQDWLDSDLVRGVVLQSGVSTQNRLLDRHRGLHGAYWKSYDFAKNAGKGNLIANPLGPKFAANPHPERAFAHDGGEMVFHLPNGMQGYYLADKDGKRIAEGPAAIVSDPNQWSGTTIVVNGLSCMGCHKNGMLRFQDVVRSSVRLAGPELAKVQDLFPEPKELNEWLTSDEDRFLAASLRALGPVLNLSTAEDVRNLEFEPVGKLAQFYHADVNFETALAELNIRDASELRNAIRFNSAIFDVLGSLLDSQSGPAAQNQVGQVVKRTAWEARDANDTRQSPFQKVSQEFNRFHVPQEFERNVQAGTN